MTLKKNILVGLCAIAATLLLQGCSWPRRIPLEISPFNKKVAVQPVQSIAIQFKECVSEKPFNETVWDNVSGAFWDVKESQQIGFTQNYKPQFYAIPPPLLPVAAQAGANLIDTRLLVPFGNIFSSAFKSAAQKYLPAAIICFDEQCVSKASVTDTLEIKVENFLVWESPLNHLNFYVKGECVHLLNKKVIKRYSFEKSMLSQKVGTVLSTHNSMMKKMNQLSMEFANELTAEILQKGL